jgi:glycosyltransferase involved in cell wall biosynthesis
MRIGIQMRAMDKESGFRALTHALTQEMVQLERDVTFVLFYKTRKWFGEFAHHPNVREVLVECPSNFLWDQIAMPYAAWKHRVDVLFNTKFFAPFLSHCPVTMGLQEPSWWTRPDEYSLVTRLYQRLAIPALINRCAHVFPNSRFILEENREVLRMPIEHATVTYSATEERFRPLRDEKVLRDFRRRHGLPDNFILVVTRVIHPAGPGESTGFFPGKSPEVAFRAFERIRDQIPHDIVFAGERVREYLEHTEGPRASFDRVRFLGHVPFDDIHLLYNSASIFVNPCVYEGCPNTVLQALACGRPSIVAASGGSADVAKGGALLMRPMDDEDLAIKLKTVALDPALQRSLSEDALGRARFFSWRKTARITLDVLKQVGSGRRPITTENADDAVDA